MMAMFPSSWRAPAAGVSLLSRSTWLAVRSTWSAAVFSSTRATRLVPGIGATSSQPERLGEVALSFLRELA
jgi:hypothetical protein